MEKTSEQIVFGTLDKYIRTISKKEYGNLYDWAEDVFKNAESELYDKMGALNILNNIRLEFDYYVLRHF